MTNVVFGSNVLFFVTVDSVDIAVGCATSIQYEYENEIIFKTDRNAGLFRKKRVRISDSRAAVTGLTSLVDNSETKSLFYFFQEGVRRSELYIKILFEDDNAVQKQITGAFLIQSIQVTGDPSAFSEFTINFEGTGTVTFSTPSTDSPGTVACQLQPTIYKSLAEGATSVSDALLTTEGATILWVTREGAGYNETNSNPPGNLEFFFDDTTGEIIFLVPGNPASPELEKIAIGWYIAP